MVGGEQIYAQNRLYFSWEIYHKKLDKNYLTYSHYYTHSNRLYLGMVGTNEKIKFLYRFYKKDLTNYKNFITL